MDEKLPKRLANLPSAALGARRVRFPDKNQGIRMRRHARALLQPEKKTPLVIPAHPLFTGKPRRSFFNKRLQTLCSILGSKRLRITAVLDR
jgi:hypothetical protein